jgi:hypothetical protein
MFTLRCCRTAGGLVFGDEAAALRIAVDGFLFDAREFARDAASSDACFVVSL